MNNNSSFNTLAPLLGYLLLIIRGGCIFRIVFCFFTYITNIQENGIMKKRAIHTILFWIFAELIIPLSQYAIKFF